QFLASGGFCRHHAWRFVLQHDILGTAILYRALLRDAGRHRRVAAHCQLCLSYESGEGSALDILEYGLDEATFADKFAQSDGLCDPPLRDGPSPPGRQGCPSPAAGGDKTAFAVPARRAHPEAGLQVRRRTERGRGRLVATCSQRRRRFDAQALPRRRSRKLPPSKSESARQNEGVGWPPASSPDFELVKSKAIPVCRTDPAA